jgi:hypothetical protein
MKSASIVSPARSLRATILLPPEVSTGFRHPGAGQAQAGINAADGHRPPPV